jgi:ribosomal protein S18 acetylase RimI-like enzyme
MLHVWRPLRVADLKQWSELTDIVADADGTAERYSADDLAEELDDPATDPETDTVAVEGERGSLVAVGQVHAPVVQLDGFVRAAFAGMVHPEHRGLGIGAELLARLERRALQLAAARHPGIPVQASTHAAAQARDARRLFEAYGYDATRYFHEMSHDLSGVDAVRDPRTMPYQPEFDDEIRLAHCAAFSTHWGFAPPDEERWRHLYTGSRTFRPRCSAMAVADDGSVDGYALAYQYQPGELWIGQVGVRRRARGQGLARALLRHTLAAATPEFDIVRLDVDSANADGAGRLYESVGFVAERTAVIYRKGARP